MDFIKTKNIIEAILFAAGDPVLISAISKALECTDADIENAVLRLNAKYEEGGQGLQIIRLDNAYQMCTRKDFFEYIQEILGSKPKQGLSVAALEALSIIAYNQPITRSSIDYVRGVNSDGAVTRLLERGLIEESGRLDSPGRPILFVTTDGFLRAFGLSSISELPDIANISLGNELEDQQGFEF